MVEKFPQRIPKEQYQEEADDFADTEGLPIEGANDPAFVDYIVEETVTDGVSNIASTSLLTRDDFSVEAIAKKRAEHQAKVAAASEVVKSEEEAYAESVVESVVADESFSGQELTAAPAQMPKQPRLSREDFDPKMIMLRKMKLIPQPGDFQSPALVSPEEVEEIVADEELQKKGLITPPPPIKVKSTQPPLTRQDFTKKAIEEKRRQMSALPVSRAPLGSDFPEDFKIDKRLRVDNVTKNEDSTYFPDTVSEDYKGTTLELVDDAQYETKPQRLSRQDFTDEGITNARIKQGTVGKNYYPPANSVPIKYAPKSVPPKPSLFKRLVPGFLKKWFR